LGKRWKARSEGPAKRYREKLAELYGREQASKVNYAEAFEVSEYGAQPSASELRKLFPFFD
jgi:hypothetical protein